MESINYLLNKHERSAPVSKILDYGVILTGGGMENALNSYFVRKYSNLAPSTFVRWVSGMPTAYFWNPQIISRCALNLWV